MLNEYYLRKAAEFFDIPYQELNKSRVSTKNKRIRYPLSALIAIEYYRCKSINSCAESLQIGRSRVRNAVKVVENEFPDGLFDSFIKYIKAPSVNTNQTLNAVELKRELDRQKERNEKLQQENKRLKSIPLINYKAILSVLNSNAATSVHALKVLFYCILNYPDLNSTIDLGLEERIKLKKDFNFTKKVSAKKAIRKLVDNNILIQEDRSFRYFKLNLWKISKRK